MFLRQGTPLRRCSWRTRASTGRSWALMWQRRTLWPGLVTRMRTHAAVRSAARSPSSSCTPIGLRQVRSLLLHIRLPRLLPPLPLLRDINRIPWAAASAWDCMMAEMLHMLTKAALMLQRACKIAMPDLGMGPLSRCTAQYSCTLLAGQGWRRGWRELQRGGSWRI